MALVRIGKIKQQPRAIAARCADQLFTLGMVAAAAGSVAGMLIWLNLGGVVAPTSQFARLRSFHAFTQLFLFLGAFICGFILQAARTFMRSDSDPGRHSSFATVLCLVASVIGVAVDSDYLARGGAFGAYVLTLSAILPLIVRSPWETKLRLGFPYAAGLLALAVSAATFDGTSVAGLVALWAGVAPIIFATAQRFIEGTFGTRPLPMPMVGTLYSLHLIGALALFVRHFSFVDVPWEIIGASAVAVVAGYVVSTGLYVGVTQVSKFRDPLAVGLLCAFCWAAGGSLALGFPDKADAVVHAWGLGWAFTLVIAVSARVVRTVTLKETVPDAVLGGLLAGWQLLVAARVFYRYHSFPAFVYWSCIAIGCAAIAVWLGGLSRAIGGLIVDRIRARRSRNLAG